MGHDEIEILAARARKEVDEGLLPSCQWALARDGEVIAGETVGDAPAGADSRYVIYSCTKAVTASASGSCSPRARWRSPTGWSTTSPSSARTART